MLVVLVLLRRKKHRPSIAVASGWFILRFTFMLAVTVFIAGVKTLTGSRV